MRIILLLVCGSMWLLLTACDSVPPGQTVSMGGYTVVFSHQPDPLLVGYEAKLQVRINDRQGRALRECKAGFRQFMPGMEMEHDHAMVNLTATDGELYRGTTKPFSMGGDWVLELTMDCGDGPVSHTFSYQLEWPE